MMSPVPEKIVLRSTTKISLNDRFVNATHFPQRDASYVFMSVSFSNFDSDTI